MATRNYGDLFDLDAFLIGALTYYLIACHGWLRLRSPHHDAVETKPKLETIPPRVIVRFASIK